MLDKEEFQKIIRYVERQPQDDQNHLYLEILQEVYNVGYRDAVHDEYGHSDQEIPEAPKIITRILKCWGSHRGLNDEH